MKYFRTFLALAGLIAVCPSSVRAGEWRQAGETQCTADHFRSDGLTTYAEAREQRLPNGSINYINSDQNGSIHVHGWDNADVRVRACIYATAPSDSEARALASQVTITRSSGMIEPSGPTTQDRSSWAVSYEVWVPKASNVDLKANNGSISVDTVHGQIRFHTQNGSVRLNSVAGDVNGSTTNGSLRIDVDPSQWRGNGLRAETTNGSVHLNLPDGVSAQVQASTVNGKVSIDFPVTVSGEIGKTMSFQLGGGGPLIEARTVNGSVHIGRRS